MQSPAIHEEDGRKEKREVAGLITEKLFEIQLKWLPIQEYEKSGMIKNPMKSAGKKRK
jgi:hypothetical protein